MRKRRNEIKYKRDIISEGRGRGIMIGRTDGKNKNKEEIRNK
jgi:hypothetical protein